MKTLFTPDQIKKSRELGARRFYNITNEYDCLKRNAFAYSKSEAVIDTFYGVEYEKRRRRNWPQVLSEVNLWIFNLMEKGLKKGGFLIVQLPNCIEHWYSYLAASKIGCWHLSNHVDFGPEETLQILEHVEPDIAIIVPTWHGRDILGWYKKYQEEHPGLKHIFVVGDPIPAGTEPVSDLLDGDVKEKYSNEDLDALRLGLYEPWFLLETAGTTGMPKLIIHDSYIFHSHDICLVERFNYNHYDRCLVLGPLSGSTPKRWGIAQTVYSGATTILLTEFIDEDACRLTEEEKITMWIGIPTLGERALTGPFAEKYNLGSLRTIASGGAPVSFEVASRLIDKGIKVINAYGTSESGGCVVPSFLQSKEELFYSVGKPLEGYDVAIVNSEGNRLPQGETGEVYIWTVHHGYYRQPELEKEAWIQEGPWKGYQRTGDLGYFDEQGNLHIVGRVKDMILRGAQNIFPKEIEDLLISYPKIHQVSIVRMPDPVLHEKACAFVVPKTGEQFTFEEMISFLETKGVAKFKYPERLEIVEELPMTVGGKVSKQILEQNIAEKLKKEGKMVANGKSV